MKKIVNGRKYDTDTATFIASRDNNTSGLRSHVYTNDFDYWSQSVYKKKNGEYFLVARNCVANVAPDFYTDETSNFLIITEDQAKSFCENSDQDYEEIWGEVSE